MSRLCLDCGNSTRRAQKAVRCHECARLRRLGQMRAWAAANQERVLEHRRRRWADASDRVRRDYWRERKRASRERLRRAAELGLGA